MRDDAYDWPWDLVTGIVLSLLIALIVGSAVYGGWYPFGRETLVLSTIPIAMGGVGVVLLSLKPALALLEWIRGREYTEYTTGRQVRTGGWMWTCEVEVMYRRFGRTKVIDCGWSVYRSKRGVRDLAQQAVRPYETQWGLF